MSFRGGTINIYNIQQAGGITALYKTGLWYKGALSGGGSGGLTLNEMHAYPIFIAPGTVFDRWAVQVMTLNATGTGRFGMYYDDGHMYPGALLREFGTQSMAATGVFEQAFAPVLSIPVGGWYWLAGVQQGSAGGNWNVGVTSEATILPVVGESRATSQVFTADGSAYETTGVATAGALPANFPAVQIGTFFRANSGINIGLRAA